MPLPIMPSLVLVVDDEPNLVDLVELHLVAAGFEVMTAATGRAALDLIAARRPDLILLDLMLPDIDGFGVCEILRSGAETVDLPIVIMSEWRSTGARKIGWKLGAVDYLAKPFRGEELISRVRRSLNVPSPTGAESLSQKPTKAVKRKPPTKALSPAQLASTAVKSAVRR